MRVTTMMRSYIKDTVAKKVADRLEKAEAADREQKERDREAIKSVTEYAESMIPEMTKKVAAFAKKQGLTWFEHRWGFCGPRTNEVNNAFSIDIRSVDFAETCDYDDNKSPGRLKRNKIEEEPERIRKAINHATNSVVFSLELGKVKKAELEELLASIEVEL
jgi:DNA-binding MarR family transcriptional regulator